MGTESIDYSKIEILDSNTERSRHNIYTVKIGSLNGKYIAVMIKKKTGSTEKMIMSTKRDNAFESAYDAYLFFYSKTSRKVKKNKG